MGSEHKNIGQVPVFPSDEWTNSVMPGTEVPKMTLEEIYWLERESGHEQGGNPDLFARLLERERIIDYVAENGGLTNAKPQDRAALDELVGSISEAKRQLPPSP